MTHDGSRRVPALTALYALKYAAYILLCALIISPGLIGHRILCSAAAEALAVFLATNALYPGFPACAYVLNSLALLIGNVQCVVMLHGGSYVSLQMLTNLGSLRGLSGHGILYAASLAAAALPALLPVRGFRIPRPWNAALPGFLAACILAGLCLQGFYYSPYAAAVSLARGACMRASLARSVRDGLRKGGAGASPFRKAGVGDRIGPVPGTGGTPNLIVVFTEGLSENIIHDGRGIMPNAARLERESVSFRNYYNHTFATYMGLSGQLHSGYQQGNFSRNMLPSLQSLLGDAGYRTCFINTEPGNRDFTEYLEALGFGEVVSGGELLGPAGSVSDRRAYELLYERAAAMAGEGEPFFIAIYTFGTHASFDSVDEVFGDGRDPLLNKFHNADAQLGRFLGRLRGGGLAESTVLVLTADHCTYADADFRSSFPGYVRESPMCDRIPLIIHCGGMAPREYDAGGRNSLCLAPTLLDLLGVSGENCFLGSSLFGEADGEYERTFQSLTTVLRTDGGTIRAPGMAERAAFGRALGEYFVLAGTGPGDGDR